jgi:succinate-acetate transporter protein
MDIISGLVSFASTTLIISLFNANAGGVTVPNVVVGMSIFCSGLAQTLVGLWEFPRGETFSASGKRKFVIRCFQIWLTLNTSQCSFRSARFGCHLVRS